MATGTKTPTNWATFVYQEACLNRFWCVLKILRNRQRNVRVRHKWQGRERGVCQFRLCATSPSDVRMGDVTSRAFHRGWNFTGGYKFDYGRREMKTTYMGVGEKMGVISFIMSTCGKIQTEIVRKPWTPPRTRSSNGVHRLGTTLSQMERRVKT